MLEQKKNAAIGMMLGVLLVGGTAVQASAQETQDTSKAPTQDTSAYSAPARADTSAPAGVTDSSAKAGTDTSKISNDSALSDTSQAGKKAWKKKHKNHADSASAK